MNIAELGVKIDSADAVEAKTSLDEMAKAGGRAERSAVSLMNEMQALEKSLGTSAKTTQEVAKQRDALAKLTKTGAYGEAEAAKISAQLDKQQVALAKSAMDEQKALNSLLGAIDPTRAALSKLDTQVEQLGKHLDAGRISQDDYNTALSKIDKDYDKLTKTATGFDKLRLGTRQAQENVMQLGNALSSGDWGSGVRAVAQLGAGAGTSAGQLGKMLIPAGALVTVLGSIAYAFIDAERESSAFNKAIYAGGNTAGVTSEQLQQIAKEAGDVTHNFAGAKEAALALASSGKVAQSQLLNLTEAAAAISTLTGKGADEVASSLAGLGSSATDAAVKISEQYGLLTSEQYLAIKAIEDEGDAQKALDTLSEDLNRNAQERLKQYRASLSDIELGWDDIKNSITRAYGAVRSEVFPDLAKQIEIVQRVLDTRKAGGVAGAISTGLSSLNSALGLDDSENDDSTAALEKKLASLKARQKASQDAAAATGEESAANKELIAVQRDLDRQLDNVNPLAKREAAIKKLNEQFTQLYQDAAKTGQRSPLLSGVDFDGKAFSGGAYDKLLAGINEKNKDAKGPANQLDLTGFNDAQNNLKSIAGYYQNLEKELDSAQKAGLVSAESYSSQRVAIVEQEKGDVTTAYEAEIAALEALRDKSSTTGQQRIQLDQKIADARASMVKAQKDADSQLEVLANNEKGRIDKQTRSIAQYIQALDQQQKALELAGQRAVLGVGRGDRQNALDAQLNAQQDRFAQQTLDLANQKSDPSRNMSEEEFAKKSQALADANKKATDQIRQNYVDVQTAQGDWTNGATAAWENYLDSARDIAGQMKSLFTNAFSSMEDAVVNFALTGKLSFSDFAKSILADMARIATRQASSSLLSSLFGAGLSYFSGGGGNGLASGSAGAVSSNLGASQAGYSSTYFPQADGGAWLNGVQMFANGGAFTNSVVSSPTAFGMAGGKLGVMGEAGDEAIMPLTRTSSGALGVRAVSAGGGSSVQISAPVSITVEDRSSEGMQLDQTALAQNLQAQIKQAAEKAVADSWRPGGVSFRQTRT